MNTDTKIVEWIKFNNFEKLYNSSLIDLAKLQNYKNKFNFLDINIYQYPWSYFVLELKDLERFAKFLDSFIGNYKDNFEPDWNQFPKILSHWENDWTYFLLVEATNKINDNFNEQLWIYKWIIFDPLEYLKL